MDVIAVGPLRAGSLLWQKEEGGFALTVVAKLTATLLPGRCEIAPAEEVNEREQHWDDDPARSLFVPSDLAPQKRRAEVVLVGHAFAPMGKPSRAVVVRLVVGEVDKVIEVVGPRVLTRDGEVREGPRWTRMPLRYERAAGGPGTWNPVGVSADAPLDPYGQRPLPNLQPPGLAPGQQVPPAGFGPIAAGWPTRRERLGARAVGFRDEQLADAPLPEDVDPLYFQVAPRDQQLDELRGDERMILEHLHPEHARLSTQLPGVRPRAFVDAPGAMAMELPLVADTLWIDTDRALCTITWRGQLALSGRDQRGRVVIAAEPPGQRLQWQAVRELVAQNVSDTVSLRGAPAEVTQPGHAPAAFRALPFATPAEVEPKVAVASATDTPRPQRSGPRITEEVVVGDNPALVPPWLAAPEHAPPRPPVAPRFGSAPPPPLPVTVPAPLAAAVSPPPPAIAAAVSPPLSAIAAVAPSAPPAPIPPPLITSAQPGSMRAVDVPPLAAPPLEADGKSMAKAGYEGALAASNAAARRGVAPRRPEAPREVAAPLAEKAGGAQPGVALEIIWFDADVAPRVRATEEWAALSKPPARPAPPMRGAPPPPASPDAANESARAAFAAVLAQAKPASVVEIEAALEGALARGAEAPLVLAAGELELPLDPVALLEATASTAAPLAAADKKLKEALDAAAEAIAAGVEGAPEIVEALLARIRDAWTKANRSLPPAHVTAQPVRALLTKRRYEKRDLLDATFLRALFHAGGSEAPVPVYVPASLDKRLPLFLRFPVRAVLEALPRQDQYEDHPLALRLRALARVIAPPGRAAARG